jgi:hypothetical protein
MLGRSMANEAAPPMGSVKSISNELFREYDKDRTGEITDAAIVQMLKDTYKLIETDFQPSYTDIQEFRDLLDIDRDGRLGRGDLEGSMMRFLNLGVDHDGNLQPKNKNLLIDMSQKQVRSPGDVSYVFPVEQEGSFNNRHKTTNNDSPFKAHGRQPYDSIDRQFNTQDSMDMSRGLSSRIMGLSGTYEFRR